MNWGWKLTIVYLAFAGGILTLVFKAKGEKVDLVARDYYVQELAFGQRIEASRNAAALSAPVAISVTAEKLTVSLPEECNSQQLAGTVTLYCPSDAASDAMFDMVAGQRDQVFEVSGKKKGIYIVRVSWKMSEKSFYVEKSVTL